MKIVRTIEGLNAARSGLKERVAFVPTMGALHDGHLSLIARAREETPHVVASIFVNPTQFAPNEDFDTYPRDEEGDAQKLEKAGVEILFLPTKEVLYADGLQSAVETGEAAQGLEAIFRPTHFAGVVNVVDRLFKVVKPDIAIFGEKDFQQLQVIREMVAQYKMPIEIIGAPIKRDISGLALSSRNAYLSAEQMKSARRLNLIIRDATQSGDVNKAQKELLDAGFDKVDYVEKRWNRVLAAVWIGKTRLIDNMPVT